ncbi:putative Cysteine-rich venom protein [Naja naja]|nr:putative Cysteine-rich venom protein [Naja naja]
MSSNARAWTEIIQLWHDEYKNFVYGVGANPPGSVTGHYTQNLLPFGEDLEVRSSPSMVLSALSKLETQTRDTKTMQTKGNFEGLTATPYELGPPCGDCPSACDNGVCSTKIEVLFNNGTIQLTNDGKEVGDVIVTSGLAYFIPTMNTTTQVIANFSNDGVKNGKEEGEKDDNADSDTSDEEIEGETNPCKYVNTYSNCESLVNRAGCHIGFVRAHCRATCFCHNKII